MQEATFVDRHGVDVFHRRWAAGDPTGAVVVAHGATEHSGRYDRFASALVASGFDVWALDHRGHGRTARSTGRGRTGPGGGDALVDDLDALLTMAVDAVGDAPVVLFGHSMGATISLAFATRHAARIAGLVLCGFPSPPAGVADMREALEAAVAAGLGELPMDATMSTYNDAFEPARTPFDWLSRDDAEVDRYLADEHCGPKTPLTYGFVLDLLQLTAPALEPTALAQVSCPTLVLAGDRDPAAGMGSFAVELAGALRDAGVAVTCRLYEGARHELLNETNRDEVTDDIVRWIRDRTR